MERRGDPVLFSTASDSVGPRVGPRVNPAHRSRRAAKARSEVLEPVFWNEWRTTSEAEAAAFARALSDPVRRAVLRLLDLWPMRQFELTQILSEATGRRRRDSLLYYHLRALERAGLIGFGAGVNENREGRPPQGRLPRPVQAAAGAGAGGTVHAQAHRWGTQEGASQGGEAVIDRASTEQGASSSELEYSFIK